MAYSIERQRPPVEKANLEDIVCQAHGQRLHILDSRASKPAARHFGRFRWQGSGEAGHGVDSARAESCRGVVSLGSDVDEQHPHFDTMRGVPHCLAPVALITFFPGVIPYKLDSLAER